MNPADPSHNLLSLQSEPVFKRLADFALNSLEAMKRARNMHSHHDAAAEILRGLFTPPYVDYIGEGVLGIISRMLSSKY